MKKFKENILRWQYFWYRISLLPIHHKSLKAKLLAYEKFTGISLAQLKHENEITHYTSELLDLRSHNIDLMNENRKLKKDLEKLQKYVSIRNENNSNLK